VVQRWVVEELLAPVVDEKCAAAAAAVDKVLGVVAADGSVKLVPVLAEVR